jgi:hypothetical protein
MMKYYTESREERSIISAIKRRMADWIGHILRRKWLLQHVTEGNTEGARRRGQRRKQLLYDLKERTKYWNFKKETLDRSVWRSGFGQSYGLVIRHAT